jgi:hypothetical protein
MMPAVLFSLNELGTGVADACPMTTIAINTARKGLVNTLYLQPVKRIALSSHADS